MPGAEPIGNGRPMTCHSSRPTDCCRLVPNQDWNVVTCGGAAADSVLVLEVCDLTGMGIPSIRHCTGAPQRLNFKLPVR